MSNSNINIFERLDDDEDLTEGYYLQIDYTYHGSYLSNHKEENTDYYKIVNDREFNNYYGDYLYGYTPIDKHSINQFLPNIYIPTYDQRAIQRSLNFKIRSSTECYTITGIKFIRVDNNNKITNVVSTLNYNGIDYEIRNNISDLDSLDNKSSGLYMKMAYRKISKKAKHANKYIYFKILNPIEFLTKYKQYIDIHDDGDISFVVDTDIHHRYNYNIVYPSDFLEMCGIVGAHMVTNIDLKDHNKRPKTPNKFDKLIEKYKKIPD